MSVTATKPPLRLAIQGGQPSIQRPAPSLRRWGDPERQQLALMIEQPSLFYWKGPQTTLLVQNIRSITHSNT